MPADAETIRQDIVLKDAPGAHDQVVLSKYEAPMDGDVAAVDPFKERDFEVARTMKKWLDREYPGHLWACIADLRQGIVKFNIPILMGIDQWWVVNLGTHDVIDGLRMGAGQILERYRLPRGRFHLASFLEARAKHSRLVLPTRKVPE